MKLRYSFLVATFFISTAIQAVPQKSNGWVLLDKNTIRTSNPQGGELILRCTEDGNISMLLNGYPEDKFDSNGQEWSINDLPVFIHEIDEIGIQRALFDATGLADYKPIFDVCSWE